jgi:hypothetical protein
MCVARRSTNLGRRLAKLLGLGIGRRARQLPVVFDVGLGLVTRGRRMLLGFLGARRQLGLIEPSRLPPLRWVARIVPGLAETLS